MCGIAGVVAREAQKYQENLQDMVSSLMHRGPDDSGIHFFRNCALGHARLSIIDLQTGQQPMISPVSDAAITFNGEIYGYHSVRAGLSDFPFRTTSDTEVILALYHRYGTQLLDRLPGMFAFAIWDEARQELLCARDRFGEKPLYYAFGRSGEFLFASEIKALLASGLVKPVLSRTAAAHYMKRLYVHPHQTIYENIYTLPPAHMLSYKEGKLTVRRYWNMPETQQKLGLDEALEQFKYLFDQAVTRQLVADVPVGAFLSGGLDSSTLVAAASRHKENIQTFSFGFADSGSSELPFAREIAEMYQTDHIELLDEGIDIGQLLVTMQDVYDEPFADSSNIPTYLISKMASRYTKVVLTGDGGDELLGGYSWYKPLLYMTSEREKPKHLSSLLRMAISLWSRMGLPFNADWQYKIQGLEFNRKYRSVVDAHAVQNVYFANRELEELGLALSDSYSGEGNASDTVDDAMRADIEDYMPGDILVKIDRASMANSLELRAPFLDFELASFCITLPFQLKINNEQDKLILREAYTTAWPSSVRVRRKQGFGAPVSKWLQHDSVRELKEQYLKDFRQKVFEVLPFKDIHPYVNRNDYKTWILLVLALWMDKHDFCLA